MHYDGRGHKGKVGVIVTKEKRTLVMGPTEGSLPLAGKPGYYDGSGRIVEFVIEKK